MTKELKAAVKEFAGSISENDLLFVTTRLSDRFGGDLADALNFLSRYKNVDVFLASARSSDEFYRMLDIVSEVLRQECERKNLFNNAA